MEVCKRSLINDLSEHRKVFGKPEIRDDPGNFEMIWPYWKICLALNEDGDQILELSSCLDCSHIKTFNNSKDLIDYLYKIVKINCFFIEMYSELEKRIQRKGTRDTAISFLEKIHGHTFFDADLVPRMYITDTVICPVTLRWSKKNTIMGVEEDGSIIFMIDNDQFDLTPSEVNQAVRFLIY